MRRFIGQMLVEHGQPERALQHYRMRLASSLPLNEECAGISVKADRLARATQGIGETALPGICPVI